VQEPQPVSIVQDYAVVSDQEHKVKVYDFKDIYSDMYNKGDVQNN
jgi:hypothetical protein